MLVIMVEILITHDLDHGGGGGDVDVDAHGLTIAKWWRCL